MLRLTILVAAGAVVLAACGGSAEAPVSTTEAVAGSVEPTTTTVAETTTTAPLTTTTETVPETTTTTEIVWVSARSDAELAEAMSAVCGLAAMYWDASTLQPVEEYGAEMIAFVTEGATNEEDAERAVREAAWLFQTQDCPTEWEGFTIPAEVEPYLREVGDWMEAANG